MHGVISSRDETSCDKFVLQTPYTGLKEAAKRGLVAMFNALCRKMMQPSRLGKQDEHGLSLLHYAAMNNHPQIIAQLLIQSMDVNVRRNNIMGTGMCMPVLMLLFLVQL